MSLPFISTEDIQDRSKASSMTKSLLVIQISWFVIQLIGRASQRLLTSSLEVFTLAIVGSTFLESVLWWHKPLDVRTPMIINLAHNYPDIEWRRYFNCESRSDIVELAEKRIPNFNMFTLWNKKRAGFMILTTLFFGTCHLLAWNWSFPSYTEQVLWRIASVACAVLPAVFCVVQIIEGRGPESDNTEIKHGSRPKPTNINTIFGTTQVHGTRQAVHQAKDGTISRTREVRREAKGGKSNRLDQKLYILIFFYLVFRVYLLVEIFAGLRSTPQGVYTTVQWLKYLPHF